MATNQRLWTTEEVEQLRTWRNQNPPVVSKLCAKRLGRSLSAVYLQLHRMRLKKSGRKVRNSVQEQVRQLVAKRYHDAKIALILGKAKQTVKDYRQQLGLKANKCPGWASGCDKKHRRTQRVRFRCDACNILCPVAIYTGWKELSGWKTREVEGATLLEVYCPKCFEEYGWVEIAPHHHRTNKVLPESLGRHSTPHTVHGEVAQCLPAN